MKRSSMKKIALVTLDYPPQQGGVARYLWNLAKALGEATVTVFVDRTHPVSVDAPAEKVRLFVPGPLDGGCRSFRSGSCAAVALRA